jgi:hypothetical protein
MSEYEYHLGMRLDGKYYCVIFQHGVPLAIAFTDDYDTEEEAIEAAKVLVREKQVESMDNSIRAPNQGCWLGAGRRIGIISEGPQIQNNDNTPSEKSTLPLLNKNPRPRGGLGVSHRRENIWRGWLTLSIIYP